MSSNPFDISMLVTRLLGSSPFLLVAFAGLVLCMIRESRPTRVRIAVGCALAIQLAGHLVLPLLYGYIFQLFQSNPLSGGFGNSGIIVVNLLSSSSSAIALGLLLWAAFSNDDRPATAAESP